MSLEKEFKQCPYSKIMFEAKRENQIFATAKDRIAFNNKKNNLLRKKLNVINKQLYQNYKIAEEILENNQDTLINSQFLRGRGFSFKTFTHFVKQDDEYVIGLYDLYLVKKENNNYLIFRKND